MLRHWRRRPAGGRSFPERIEELPEIYRQISDELSSQYSVGYISGNPLRNGQWRRVLVRTDRDAVSTRSKQGYYAPRG